MFIFGRELQNIAASKSFFNGPIRMS